MYDFAYKLYYLNYLSNNRYFKSSLIALKLLQQNLKTAAFLIIIKFISLLETFSFSLIVTKTK